ncbi:MAG: amidohydrolase family protein [Parasphingorhabdus sp.]|uniref:N-acyl-D-amino-acid deacylase family protein n=1 Tax=Parasphingorhabdus sp. TaxID=2709688 RepID=UPI003296C755
MEKLWYRALLVGSATALLNACVAVPAVKPALSADLLIVGGTIVDGTGEDGYPADMAIKGDRIVFVGDALTSKISADETLNVSGMIVAPGFIDPHTHAGGDLDSDDARKRANLPFAFQGVTTVMVGNDGNGDTAVAAKAKKAADQGIGTNVTYMAGFGRIRKTVIGDENRAPTDAELGAMKAMMASAMCEGARGLSAGLYYTPQNFAKTEEVIALAKIAAKFGGYYDTHMRDESTYNIGLEGALREAMEIGKQSGTPLHIAHIKALGPAVWGHSAKMIGLIEQAQANGQKITADQYPWRASGTRISNALVPRWALDGGLSGLRKRLQDNVLRARIRSEMSQGLKRRGGAEALLFTGSLGQANVLTGITLAQYAADKSLHPLDAAIEILKKGDSRVASFNMKPSDINTFASRDWVVTGSDGSAGHPRKYASFPKAYRDFVQDKKFMSLAQFVRRSSGKTADILGLKDRGYLKAGMVADIVIFDPQKFTPVATYQNPRRLSKGVKHLLVNGVPVIADGKHTGALPGKPLLKESSC